MTFRLKNIHRPGFQNFAHAEVGVAALARSHGHIYVLGHFLERGNVFRNARLLDPSRSVRLEPAPQIDGRRGAEAAVHFDKDFYVRPYRFAQRCHDIHREIFFFLGDFQSAGAERIDFQRLVAFI